VQNQSPGSSSNPPPRLGSVSRYRLATLIGTFLLVYEFGFDHLQHSSLIPIAMTALGVFETGKSILERVLASNKIAIQLGPLRVETAPIVDTIKIPTAYLPPSLDGTRTTPSPTDHSSTTSLNASDMTSPQSP
jgi:hypothetical protein